MHIGDPCIHCGLKMEDVPSGPCAKSQGNAARIRRFLYYKKLLAEHEAESAAETKRLSGLIYIENTAILQIESGLDFEQVTVAESVMYVHGDYGKAGEDRERCRTRAIHWFATNESRGPYGNLQNEYFGTKDYDRWHGQGSDHNYGYGPNYGSIIFSIGLQEDARRRDLTDAEREACVYYLLNLSAIQEAQRAAKLNAQLG